MAFDYAWLQDLKSALHAPAILVALSSVQISAPAAETVFGLELGKPVTLQECPYRLVATTKLYEPTPSSTCVSDAHRLNGYPVEVREMVFSASETPPIVKNWRAFLLEVNGLLIGLHFLTPGVEAQTSVLDQLRSKYGAPTRLSSREVQNLSGARFEAVSAQWESPTVVVTFEGVSAKLTYGEVFIDTPEAAAMRKQWRSAEQSLERKL